MASNVRSMQELRQTLGISTRKREENASQTQKYMGIELESYDSRHSLGSCEWESKLPGPIQRHLDWLFKKDLPTYLAVQTITSLNQMWSTNLNTQTQLPRDRNIRPKAISRLQQHWFQHAVERMKRNILNLRYVLSRGDNAVRLT